MLLTASTAKFVAVVDIVKSSQFWDPITISTTAKFKGLFDAGPDDGALCHLPHRHGLPVD